MRITFRKERRTKDDLASHISVDGRPIAGGVYAVGGPLMHPRQLRGWYFAIARNALYEGSVYVNTIHRMLPTEEAAKDAARTWIKQAFAKRDAEAKHE